MDILLTIHSFLPLLIAAMAVLAVFKFAIGWRMNSSFKGMDRGLASGFSGLMDLQMLLGLIFFLWNGFSVTDEKSVFFYSYPNFPIVFSTSSKISPDFTSACMAL